MPCIAAACQHLGHRAQRCGRRVRVTLVVLLARLAWAAGWAALVASAAQAQGVEIVALQAVHGGQAIHLDYQLRVSLPKAVEEAALRGVPLYFTARATLWQPRWYWRDERLARATRAWRLSYQPLTSNWRVSQGGLGQSHASLAEALAAMTRSAGWRIADARELDNQQYLEFTWRLDTDQLPRPLQIGLSGVGGAGDWALGVEHRVPLGKLKR